MAINQQDMHARHIKPTDSNAKGIKILWYIFPFALK